MRVEKRMIESELNDVIARKVFVTLVKLYPRGYSILNDGNFVKRIYAATDEEAINQFNELATKGELLTESFYAKNKNTIIESVKPQTLVESVMADLSLEVKESGGKEKWLEQSKCDLADLKDYLKYLEDQAYREVGNGGNFDSKEEVDETIADTKNRITELSSKIEIVNKVNESCKKVEDESKEPVDEQSKKVDEALHGMNEIEQFVKMAKAIGLKTMGDVKKFLDCEGDGKDILTALYDYLHDEIGDLEFQAKDESLNRKLFLSKLSKDESLNESVEEQTIEDTQESIGIELILSDLIKDEFEAIDRYNSAIATLTTLSADNDEHKYDAIIANLNDIKSEELVHVGQLQKCLTEVSPASEAIEHGQNEAELTIASTEEEIAKGEDPGVLEKSSVITDHADLTNN